MKFTIYFRMTNVQANNVETLSLQQIWKTDRHSIWATIPPTFLGAIVPNNNYATMHKGDDAFDMRRHVTIEGITEIMLRPEEVYSIEVDEEYTRNINTFSFRI